MLLRQYYCLAAHKSITVRLHKLSNNATQYRLSMFVWLLTCAFIFGLQTAAYANSGDLDPTFGTGGTVLARIADTGGNFFNGGSVLQSDGKIVIAGAIDANGKQNCGAARFNSNGSLDTSFGTNGRFTFVPFQATNGCQSYAIALQSDGKILLGGQTGGVSSPANDLGGSDAILIRLNANGTLDSGFGTNGFVVTFTGTPENRFGFGGGRGFGAGFITSIQVQTDGKIVAVGYAQSTANSRNDMIVLRYNANGSRDASFAAGDQANVRFDTGITNIATTSALQSDGKIIIAGYIIRNDTPAPLDSAMVRLNADGSLDTTFGAGGKVLIDLGNGSGDNINSLVILPSGKILAGGSVATNAQYFTLAQFNSNGSLDSAFGSGGKVITNIFGYGVGLSRILLQPDGKILAGGANADWKVVRFNPDASLDTSFGSGGVSAFQVRNPSIYSQCNNILLQPDGKIIATGNGQSNDVNGSQAGLARLSNNSSPSVQLSATTYNVSEGAGAATITVTRAGDVSQASSIDYATSNGTASDRKDYIAAYGTLQFNAGETSKTFQILIFDNVFVDGNRTVNITLSNPGNAVLNSPANAVLTIQDNDTTPSSSNPIDTASFFVRENYYDFLNRQPDDSGLQFWTNQYMTLLAQCNNGTAPQKCILSQRAQIAAAFFLSIEFQQTGYNVIRFYVETLNRVPTLQEFLRDTQTVQRGVVVGQGNWQDQLAQNKASYAQAFTQRADFKALYDAKSNQDYLNALFANGGAKASDEATLRSQLLTGLNNSTETRATVLQKVADSKTVYNAQYNSAFVLLQYFGYLRRNPQDSPDTNLAGYNFWLSKLNQFSLPGEDVSQGDGGLTRVRRAEMIEAFIASSEFRQRFGLQ